MSRQNFAKIKNAYTKLGKGNIRLTQSNLFLVRPINPATTTYTFPVLESEVVGLLPDEIRLNQNDEFITTHVGIYLRGHFTTETGGAETTVPLLHTYAPVQQNSDFVKSGGLYDGFMRIAVNNVTFVDKWGVRKHEYRSQSNQWQDNTVALGFNNSAEAGAKFSDDGVYDCSPMVTLSGAKKNEVTIVLPRAIQQSISNWHDNQGNLVTVSIDSIAINLFGYLGQNGAKFQ
jgi:hypothetical protein